MKLSILLFGVFSLMAILCEKSICNSQRKRDVHALQRIFQSALRKPEYLSFDHAKQQQILIAFFRILEHPEKYGDVIIKKLHKSDY